jgi:isocitrate lyase
LAGFLFLSRKSRQKLLALLQVYATSFPQRCETGQPDLEFAKQFADAIHAKFPGKLLAYNCSPSFNWKKYLDDATIAKFQVELGKIKHQTLSLVQVYAWTKE